MSTCAQSAILDSAPASARASQDWGCFRESPAADLLAQRSEKVPPDRMVYMPAGVHCVRLHGAGRMSIETITSDLQVPLNRQLQLLRAKAAAGDGAVPFIDINHSGKVVVGYPREFYWERPGGIWAIVEWTESGERLILSGTPPSFSPKWISAGERFVGLGVNVGALLTAGHKPAFEKIPRVFPITKLKRTQERAARFLRKVDSLRRETNPGLSVTEAARAVGQ